MSKETKKNEEQVNKPGLFLKLKGAAKLGFGAFCIFNPHIAFGIGAVTCAGLIAGKIANNLQGRPLKQMWTDLSDGTFTKNLKNVAGMGFGAAVGLAAPYVGMALAAVGTLSFLAKNPAGIEGLFQGGAMATAVGTVGLPAIGVALCVDGMANALGYEPNLIGRSYSFVKGMFSSLGKVSQTAEANINAPEKSLDKAVQEVQKAKTAAQEIANDPKLKEEQKKIENNLKDTVSKTSQNTQEMVQEKKSWVKSLLDIGGTGPKERGK